MSVINIQESLQEVLEIREQLERLDAENAKAVDLITPKETRTRLEQQAIEHDKNTAAARERLAQVEGRIKVGVVALGSTVKHDGIQAVFVKGRVSWDSKKLDGLALVVAEVKECRKTGAPSVSIRKVDAK